MCSGAYVRPTSPPRLQSSSSVKRHSLLSRPNFATFQRAAALSAHPLLPNQWRRPVTRKIGSFGFRSPPLKTVALTSEIQFVELQKPTGMFNPPSM